MRSLRLALVLAALLPSAAFAALNTPVSGQFAVGARTASGDLQIQLSAPTAGGTHVYTVKAARLGDLVAEGFYNAQETPVRFTLQSEAGQVAFVGKARNGQAQGRFIFDPSGAFAAQIERRALDHPSEAQLLALALSGTTLEEVDALATRLAGRNARPQAIELIAQGITTADVDAFAEVGYRNLTAAQLISFKVRGIDAGHVARLQAMGYSRITPAQVVRLHDQGVTEAGIAASNAGRRAPRSVEQLVRLHRDSQ